MCTLSFTSSFIKDAMLEDVQRVSLLAKMGGVQIIFVILIHCFVQRPSYLLQCTPFTFTFIKSLTSFDSSFFQMFGRLLGPKSFDNLGLLACKQASFSITFGGIELIQRPPSPHQLI